MHILRGLDQLNMSIRNCRPGGIKHTTPKARRNLRQRHGPSDQSQKEEFEKDTIKLHGKTPLLKPELALASAISNELRKIRFRSKPGRGTETVEYASNHVSRS